MKCFEIWCIDIFRIEKQKFNIVLLSFNSPFFIQNFMFSHGFFGEVYV